MSEAKGRFSPLPLIMVGFGLILMGAAVKWLVQATQKQVATPTSPAIAETEADLPYPQVKRIPLVDAKKAFDQKKAQFVDARGEPYFSQGHIPGAIAMSPELVPFEISRLNPQTWIITFCT